MVLIIFLVYSPVLFGHFGFRDDYRWLNAEVHHDHRYLQFNIAQGRAINGLAEDLLFSRIKYISQLAGVRLLAVCSLAAMALGIRRGLLRAGWPRSIALAGGLVAATLPAAQVYAVWALCAIESMGGVIAIAAAALAAESIANVSPMRRSIFAIAATLTFLISLMIYQPVAMLFWVMVAIDLFRPAGPPERPLRRLAWYVSIAATALGLAFIFYQLGLRKYPWVFSALDMPLDRSHLAGFSDAWAKFSWFIHGPLVDALNFGNIISSGWIAVAVGVFILIGLPAFFRGGLGQRATMLLLAAALVIATYLPNFLTAADSAGYRTQPALECLMAFYLLAAAHGWQRIIAKPIDSENFLPTWIPMSFALASAAAAACLVTICFVRPQEKELQFVRSLLTRDKVVGAQRVVVINAQWEDGISPIWHHEFGTPSSGWPPAATGLVALALREKFPGHANIPVTVDYSLSVPIDNGNASFPSDMLVIDLRQLRRVAP